MNKIIIWSASALILVLSSCVVKATDTLYSPTGTTRVVTNITVTTNVRSVYATNYGVAGFVPNLQSPVDIEVYPDTGTPSIQHLYVSDNINNMVVHLTYDGTTVTYQNYFNLPVMSAPAMMCIYGNNLYVMESTVRLAVWGPLGVNAVPVQVSPAYYTFGSGSGLGQLSGTTGGPYIDDVGTLYVADRGNNRFQSYTNLPVAGGNTIFNLCQVATIFNNQLVGATFAWGVHRNFDGTLLLIDGFNNRILNTDGNFGLIKVIGNPTTTPGVFSNIGDLATNSYRQYLVTDRNNNRVVKLDANGNLVEIIGSLGYAPNPNVFYNPLGIATDSANRFYVVDQNNNRIVIYSNMISYSYTTNTNAYIY
jgi:hypothetical protein